jgi:hypothetical protein
MGSILDQVERAKEAPVRCPICAHGNTPADHCRHVQWTFERGGPADFARFALDASPFTRTLGRQARDVASRWWQEHDEWVIDRVMHRFDARDGYVFGEIADLDMVARDIWREIQPESERPTLSRS